MCPILVGECDHPGLQGRGLKVEQAALMDNPSHFCHICSVPVHATPNEATRELHCNLCGSSFIEVVEESTRGDLERFLGNPPTPTPTQPPTGMGTGNATAPGRADASAQAGPGGQQAALHPLSRFLDQTLQSLLSGGGRGAGSGPLAAPATGAGAAVNLLGAPPVFMSPGLAAHVMADRARLATGGNSGAANTAAGNTAAGNTAGGEAGERGLPPRVELFVNRGEAARNLDTTLLNLLQPLFANGLGGSGGTAVMGDYVVGDMASLIEQLMRNDPNRHGAPPAAQSAIDTLEVVTHTEETACQECPVCKDTYSVGEEARRMPCEHIFHPACINTWLKQHNNCPVCRHELPTDDPEYERFRQARPPQGTQSQGSS